MIGIDFTFIDNDVEETNILRTSLEIFTAELLDGIAALHQEHNFIIIVNAITEGFIKRRFPKFKVCVLGGRLLAKLIYYVTLKKKNGHRLFKRLGGMERFCNSNNISFLWFPWMSPREVMDYKVTYMGSCHDLIMRCEHDDITLGRMFNEAKLTVTISSFVKQQVMDIYNIPDNMIKVVPNSIAMVSDNFPVEEIDELKNTVFILDVNSYIDRKNTLVLLKAFDAIKEQITEDLVLCGGYKQENYYEQCCAYVKEHGLSKRVHIYLGIEEAKKNWLLKNCRLFITPSENEGFGRTPIEAAVCLKPVISSKAASLEEVTQGLLHYIENPRDDKELAEKIIWVLQHPDSKEKLENIKNVFTELYAPEKIIKDYLKVFNELGWLKEANL